ncbi:MAG: M20/M25/M40 family metallo-hydrolase [Planctomycetes bacterium]|nr:M20/M25/M40 family metallo-hydrolase [Planctomycetota bacterium]
MRSHRLHLALLLALTSPAALAQDPAAKAAPKLDPAAVEAVRTTLDFLASDELAGRDTPSPGLERAVQYAVERWKKAGLVPANEQGFVLRYEMPGWRIANAELRATLKLEDGQTVELAGEKDLRLFKMGQAVATNNEPVFLRSWVDEQRDTPESKEAKSWAKLLELDGDSALWKALAGDREILAGRRRPEAPKGMPMIAVRAGALPKGKFTASVSTPAPSEVTLKLPNVVALVRGSEKPDEIVLVSAHIDHVGISLPQRGGKDAIHNGADDDATGSTAVILLAERFAARKTKPKRTLAFALFSAEEKGLMGSAALAANPPFPLEQIAVNLNLEMLGRPEPGKRFYVWFTGVSQSDFAARATPAFRATGLDVIEFAMGEQLFFASDNASFARKGVVAHSISAGSLHDDYHQPSDEPSRIDVEHMAAAIAGIERAIDAFDAAPDRPSYTEAAQKRLMGGGR